MGSDCRNNTDWRCRPWEAGLTWADLGQNGSYKNKLRLMIRVKRHLPKLTTSLCHSAWAEEGHLFSGKSFFPVKGGFQKGKGSEEGHRFKPNRMWRSPALHAERARCSPSTSRQNRERRSWQTLSASQCWQYWATQTKGLTQQQLSLFWYNEITPHWTVLLRQCCQQTSENNMSVRTGGEAAAARAPPPRSVAGLRELSDISLQEPPRAFITWSCNGKMKEKPVSSWFSLLRRGTFPNEQTSLFDRLGPRFCITTASESCVVLTLKGTWVVKQ